MRVHQHSQQQQLWSAGGGSSTMHVSTLALTFLLTACSCWSMAAVNAGDSSSPSAAVVLPEDVTPVFWGLPPLTHFQNMHVAPDDETLNHLIPRLAAKYRPSDEWLTVPDPRFYILSELGRRLPPAGYNRVVDQTPDNMIGNNVDDDEDAVRVNASKKRDKKRVEQRLSIVQPLDVLRQRMLMEIVRRKALMQEQQIQRNREIMQTAGKRNTDIRQDQQQPSIRNNPLQYNRL